MLIKIRFRNWPN